MSILETRWLGFGHFSRLDLETCRCGPARAASGSTRTQRVRPALLLPRRTAAVCTRARDNERIQTPAERGVCSDCMYTCETSSLSAPARVLPCLIISAERSPFPDEAAQR